MTESEHIQTTKRTPRDDGAIFAISPSSRVPRWRAFGIVVIAALPLVLFLLLPIIAVVWRAIDRRDHFTEQTFQILRQALGLTLMTSGITLVIVLIFGTPLAYVLARRRFPGEQLVNTLIDLPMVLPPAVAGIALLLAFGRRGLLGAQLDRFGITIGFTTAAVVMAQLFVSVPFYIRSARAGFVRISRDIEEAAAVLGAPPWLVWVRITLPLARSSLAAGAVLAWARAVGEFGATIMFAGNFAGRTQTMPLAIYGRYEAGDLETAILLSAVLLFSSMFVLMAVRLIGGRTGDLA